MREHMKENSTKGEILHKLKEEDNNKLTEKLNV